MVIIGFLMLAVGLFAAFFPRAARDAANEAGYNSGEVRSVGYWRMARVWGGGFAVIGLVLIVIAWLSPRI